jgi:hypothetical protein
MADELANFVGRLRADARFRKRFADAPAETLKTMGVDTTGLALPARLDERALLAHIERGASGIDIPDDVDLTKLDPDELWDRFGIIGWKPELVNRDGGVATAAAVVIYGVAVVIGSNVVVVGKQFVASLGQLKVLRQLAQLPAEELRFSIRGPDGVAVEDVPADAVSAFLEKVKAPRR